MARKSKRLAVQEEKPLENKNLYNVAVYLCAIPVKIDTKKLQKTK